MKQWPAVAVLVMLVPVPLGAAQSDGAVVLEDASGDVDLEVAGSPVALPAGVADNLDLISAAVTEDPDGFTFELQMAAGTWALPFDFGSSAALYLTHHDTEFRVRFIRTSFGGGGLQVIGVLESRPVDTEDWSTILFANEGDGVVAEANGRLAWHVARDLLADQNGAAPFPGRTLGGFWAQSDLFFSDARLQDFQGNEVAQWPVFIKDRMPESGQAETTVPVLYGLAQTGDARLFSAEPFRASNGEETTIVYRINATNVGEREHVFQFKPVGAPTIWTVSFPVPTLVLAAGETREVPVLVRTPFAHQHGGAESFIVEMAGVDDVTSVGRVEIGIRYLEIPQPAGHHDTVFFHSLAAESDNPFSDVFQTAFGFGPRAYMNAEPSDPNDQIIDVPGSGFIRGNEGAYAWNVYLDPGLRLGLDFDLSRPFTLTVPISGELPYLASRLEGSLMVLGPQGQQDQGPGDGRGDQRETTILATFASDPVDLSGRHVFEITGTILAAGDLVRYDAANDLMLRLVLYTGRPNTMLPPDNPVLEPGGTLLLPLFEYHDPIDSAFATPAGPMVHIGAAKRFANPGDLIAFPITVHDPGNAAGDYRLEVDGTKSEWARLLGADRILLEGDQVETTVIVEVPSSAKDGELADLIFQAVHAQDPTRRGLVRLVVEVDTQAEHPDDRSRIMTGDEAEDAPWPAVLPVAALIAAIVVRRRR
jgi:uncharacterized protein (TIGR03382 family)